MLPAAFPADRKKKPNKQYGASVWTCNALAWTAGAQEWDKITAFMMERGRKAFEAITDNQNSTEPREQEEITSNRESGERQSRGVSGNFF